MAQLDDIVGSVLKKLKDDGLDEDTIVVFTTDNGAENFTWPGRRPNAVRGREKGPSWKAGSVSPASFVRLEKFLREKWKTRSFPAWIGFRPLCQSPGTRTSPRN